MRAYAQWMGLTLAERRAITEAAAIRYQRASKRGKSRILDELCANTGWHRNHARKALAASLQPKIVAPPATTIVGLSLLIPLLSGSSRPASSSG
jgi:hypothetical protein